MSRTKIVAGFQPSKEQQEAIGYRGGHLQIIACAGSGKTETISRRVASLILEGIQPQEIVAFTFTERAAEGLKSRILKRVEDVKGKDLLDRLGPMYVGTIHSYCFRLLQEHVPKYANFDVLDEHRLAGLLSREHKRLRLDRLGDYHWGPIHEFMRNADVVENELMDVGKLTGDFGDCYARYCEALEHYHLLTYGQMITAAVRALEDSAVYAQVHGQLKHLIVDEYQDINPAQGRLIQLLAQPPVHLCVVGDDQQAIYQWRGSDVDNILNLTRRYRQARPLSLEVNYRSKPQIIEVANHFGKSIEPRLPKKMKPCRSDEGPQVHWWSAETPADEADIVADTVQALVGRGYRYCDIAVLLRSVRTSGAPFIEAFEKRGIPFRCGGRTGLFLQPEAQVLGKTYAWLCHNTWKSQKYSAKPEEVKLSTLTEGYQEIFNPVSASVKKLEKHLADWQEAAADDREPANLVRDYYRLLRLLGVHEWDANNPKTAARIGTLARFSELLADYEHVARRARWVVEEGGSVYRAGQNRGQWYYRRLFNYLQYYALDAYEDFEGEDTFDLDVVDIVTVHQAKGLEWPIVFVPCLAQDRFPSFNTGKEQSWLLPSKVFDAATRKRYEGTETDERRLFYVAVTRAKDMLYLSRFQRIKNRRQPSPFLVEVAGQDPEPIKSLAKRYLPPSLQDQRTTDGPDKPTLTFSELAAYECCPFSYRLSNLIGFQPQLVAELGYGKAIHHILRRIADHMQAQDRLPTAKDVECIFQDEFYLPFAHQAAFDELNAAAHKLVQRYLSKYSDDLFRIWETERPFELHLEVGVVAGRADVILDREGGVIGSMALVDYKTATDPRSPDVYDFQLAIYMAAGRGEGINMRAAYVHDLAKGERRAVPVADDFIGNARERANALVSGIIARDFEPKPEKSKCGQCDVRFVCQHGPGR